ncbi:MAG: KamA family radical SAM protein [Aquificae bacterium]|nr:KamA family radical SAM protein [Aquificota bacterium]
MRRLFKEVPEHLWRSYRWQVENAVTTKEELKKYLRLTPEEEKAFPTVTRLYPFAVTPYYLSLINPEDPEDPLRRQVVPRVEEVNPRLQRDASENPFNEESSLPGLTHRYPDRVLMVVSNFCVSYCRHCMRKRLFKEGPRSRSYEELKRMIEYVRRRESVREVLISGGEPLALPLEKLEFILKELRSIPHLEVIRIGTRLPVFAPMRFYDERLLALLERYGPIWIATHFNHPNELTPYAEEAVERLLRAGVPVFNQTVLLKGVNDEPEVLERLFRGLIRMKVKPQYLFHCDPVKGVLHFRTSVRKGLEIVRRLRGRLSGYAIPVYALDLPGGKGKVPLEYPYLRRAEGNRYLFESPLGGLVEYEIDEGP